MSSIHSILKEYWGYHTFRAMQEDIINSVLAGKDTLAILPTGGGKSICFQVPALVKEGLCLVISPLIALMKDQVQNLKKKGITAFVLSAGMTRKDVINTLKLASASNCKFLYVSPERLETKLFLEYLPALDVNLLAVDEAHCISQWGHDFRPSYLRIAELREQLPGIPVLALTASATADVQLEICNNLKFGKQLILRQSFERPNLSYSVFKVDSRIIKLVEILKAVPGSSIVYCKSRKRTKEIADQLRTYDVDADYYHAGLGSGERNEKQDNWIKNKTRTIVCTNAFGMGIDKPDVRVVVHVDAPDSLESYYQEAGRAGRDGKKAYAVMLYHEKDLGDLEQNVSLKFPSLDDIRHVYQAIVNFLQIANGLGESTYFEFDMADFLRKFKLPSHLVVNTLRVLEQEGFISFNEQIFIPSKVQFACNKEILYQFESSHKVLEPLIKTLLRSYEGIFDREVNINEKMLAYLLRVNADEVINDLHQLHNFRIISYTPQKDTPQLFFIQNRVKAEDLRIDMRQYAIRKQHYKKRVNFLVSYIQTLACRSQFIGAYFGDEKSEPCGTCDSCLRARKTVITSIEFVEIENAYSRPSRHHCIRRS
jgi:ATP-dependent DNA helicase RecQ